MKTGKQGYELKPENGYKMERSYVKYSATHLRAAAMFSRLCGKTEMENRDRSEGKFIKEIMGYTVESVILTMASLEAYIDELISMPREYFPSLKEDVRKRLIYLNEAGYFSLEKYEKALIILNQEASLDKEQYPYHDTVVLRQFKNALVHFYPEWQADDKSYKKLEEKLRNINFQLSPFYQEDLPEFPFCYMSYGCTRWAVKTAYDFMKSFSKKAGMPFHLSHIKEIFDTDISETP